MISLILFIYILKRNFTKNELFVYAGSATMWMVIASIPFLLLMLTLIHLIPGLEESSLTGILLSISPDMPQFKSLIQHVVNELYNRTPASLLSFSIITTLWSSSSGVYGIEKGIRKIYGNLTLGRYIKDRLWSVFYTFLFLTACLMMLILFLFGSVLQGFLERHFPWIASITSYVISFRTLIAAVFLFALFLLVYTFMPGKRQPLKTVIPGAVFSCISWILLSFGFSVYFSFFSNLSYVYGSLGAVVLLMFWMLAMICILFIGGEINHLLPLKDEIIQEILNAAKEYQERNHTDA